MRDCRYYEERISASLDAALTPGEAAELRAHLETCEACRDYRDALAAVDGALVRELPAPPEDLTERIMAGVRAAAAVSRDGASPAPGFARQGKLIRLIYRTGALAAAAAVILGVGYATGARGRPAQAPAPMAATSAARAEADMGAAAPAEAPGNREDAAVPHIPAVGAGAKGAEAGSAPSAQAADAAPWYVLYSGPERRETASGPAGDVLALLRDGGEPSAPAPEREAEHELRVLTEDGEQTWQLWEEGEQLLLRPGDGEGPCLPVDARAFRAALAAE